MLQGKVLGHSPGDWAQRTLETTHLSFPRPRDRRCCVPSHTMIATDKGGESGSLDLLSWSCTHHILWWEKWLPIRFKSQKHGPTAMWEFNFSILVLDVSVSGFGSCVLNQCRHKGAVPVGPGPTAESSMLLTVRYWIFPRIHLPGLFY